MPRIITQYTEQIHVSHLFVFLSLAVMVCTPGGAEPSAGKRPVVRAVRATQPPRIDGDLSDACWRTASKFTDFRLMELQQPMPYPTEAYLCYDDRAVYCAFYAHDPDPARIRAQEFKRDGSMRNDDLVELCLDEKHQFRDYSSFLVNPLGTQGERFAGGTAQNITWKGDWKAAARFVADGWTAEIEVPLRILRYPAGADGFGVFLARYVPRIDDWACYPDTGTRWDARRMLDWTGLKLPPPHRRPVWLPYSQLDYDAGSLQQGLGLDFKYQAPSGITHVATLNPDFKNIEGDVESIDFSYTERYVRDRRPFFREGRHFFPSRTLFHSLRVDQVDLAYKSFGADLGRLSYGALGTAAFGDEYNLVSSTRYTLSDKTQSGVFFNQIYHWGDGEDNAVWEAGGYVEWVRDPARWGFTVSAARSTTEGPGGEGWNTNGGFRYNGGPGRFRGGLSWQTLSPGFDARLGYVPETNLKDRRLWLGYGDKYPAGPVEEWGVGLSWGEAERWTGALYDLGRFLGGRISLRNNTWFRLRYQTNHHPPNLDRRTSFGFGWNRRDLYRSGSLFLSRGRQNSGDYRYFSLLQGFRPGRNFGLSVSLEHSEINYASSTATDYVHSQLILSLNYDLTAEKGLGGRLVARGAAVSDLLSSSSTNFYLTYRQAVRRGADVFVILGDPNAGKWRTRLAVKVVQPF